MLSQTQLEMYFMKKVYYCASTERPMTPIPCAPVLAL